MSESKEPTRIARSTGMPDKRVSNGKTKPEHRKTGRKSKAEEMQLLARLNHTYHKAAKKFAGSNTSLAEKMEAPDAILMAWWEIILDEATEVKDKMKALEVVGNRFFGKEPKAVLKDEQASHGEQIENIEDLKKFFGNPFEDDESDQAE